MNPSVVLNRFQRVLLCIAFFASVLFLPKTLFAQSACPAGNEPICKSTEFCLGLNAGFFGFAALDRPFIDLSKGAALVVDGYM